MYTKSARDDRTELQIWYTGYFYAPGHIPRNELCRKSGKQDTFMYQDIYHRMNYVANLVNRIL